MPLRPPTQYKRLKNTKGAINTRLSEIRRLSSLLELESHQFEEKDFSDLEQEIVLTNLNRVQNTLLDTLRIFSSMVGEKEKALTSSAKIAQEGQ